MNTLDGERGGADTIEDISGDRNETGDTTTHGRATFLGGMPLLEQLKISWVVKKRPRNGMDTVSLVQTAGKVGYLL